MSLCVYVVYMCVHNYVKLCVYLVNLITFFPGADSLCV